jgi:hypothetical protein
MTPVFKIAKDPGGHGKYLITPIHRIKKIFNKKCPFKRESSPVIECFFVYSYNACASLYFSRYEAK